MDLSLFVVFVVVVSVMELTLIIGIGLSVIDQFFVV